MKFAMIFLLSVIPGMLASHAETTPAPPGKLVDLGGHRLHVNCTGKGKFTVVVEDGLGDFSFDWILVQAKVEKFTRICTYDRAGYAWSDPGPKPRTFAQLNLELHDALGKLGERSPLILVGHSFGGGVVRNYSAAYPTQVAGMVLVDTTHEDQRISMGPKRTGRIRDSANGVPIPTPREDLLPTDKPNLSPVASPPGKIEPPFTLLPEKEQSLHQWAERLPALNAAEDSQKEWSAESMELMHTTPQEGILGSIPLIVLTRAKGGFGSNLDVSAEELEAERLRLQASLALLSSNGRQIVIQSGHNIHLEAPNAVADAIKEVVLACEQAKKSRTVP
ncbi:MAG TPA: alpha/beta hydrolase [Edaphobacter sp.]|jgi:pimeloyl-ACP methyl ester carboxylesterase|nr:alpha/beta hydrolase [Edaphobacter sp.]